MIDYLAAARRCATENQFNRLHIGLDADLAPAEVAAIAAIADDPDFPEAGRAWLGKIRRRTPAMFDAPEPFERRQAHRSVLVFRGRRNDAPRDDRRLLIAFTGVARRMMIPTSAFLQALDAGVWDVVLLKRARSFFEGIEGLADDLDGVLAYVGKEFDASSYASLATLGVSSGGGAAAVAALRLGARRGVSVSGVVSDDLLAAEPRPRRRAFGLLGPKTRLCFAHGAAFPPDRDAALAMSAAWGGRVRPVSGVQNHNVMGALLKRGILKPFLQEVL